MSSRSEDDSFFGTLDRIVNGRVFLRFADGQELAAPRRFLPKTAQPGDVIHLHLHTAAMAGQQREDLARAILKEILQS
ncbi:MAG: hypothetical protein AAB647_04345 [Patescibacteria group bacterium]